ncbi:oxidoreductase [Aspergillus floccosus]
MPDFPKRVSFTKTWHSKPYPFISPTRPELSAMGKNVVVTGGGTGIGLATAFAFAKAEAKSVSMIGRRLEKLQAGVESLNSTTDEQKTQVFYQVAGLSDAEQVKLAFHAIANEFGKIDILVSNAGSLPPFGLIVGYNAKDLVRGFEGKVLSAFNAVQAYLPLAEADPIILNIYTCLVTTTPVPMTSAYAITKAAALKMMEYLGAENPRLRVVCIQPGWVPTDMNGHQTEAPDVAELPAHFLMWIASPETQFLKGKFVWANCDAEELLARADEIQKSKLLN